MLMYVLQGCHQHCQFGEDFSSCNQSCQGPLDWLGPGQCNPASGWESIGFFQYFSKHFDYARTVVVLQDGLADWEQSALGELDKTAADFHESWIAIDKKGKNNRLKE